MDKRRRPGPTCCEGIDLFIIDLPDGGVRFYTYLATTLYVLRAAADAGIEVALLDRPAPLGGLRVEGPVFAQRYALFRGPL